MAPADTRSGSKSNGSFQKTLSFEEVKNVLSKNKRLNQKALKQALEYYEKNKSKLKLSDRYLAIADFSQRSTKKRLAVINLKKAQVDFYKVAHGKGSDKNHDLKLDSFSGKPGSYSTPAGFHRMTTTYHGKHGLSLKMQGLEEQNKTSMDRAIVLHGAKYVSWPHTGRSQGCPSVEMKYRDKLVKQLKGGALFYHYK